MQQAPHASRLIALLIAIATSLSCLAYNINGSVADPDGEPLPQASVRLLHLPDSAFIGGVMTNAKGHFSLSNVKNGKYTVEISYLGFASLNKDVEIKSANVNLGALKLSEGGISLAEVKITGTRTPIKVMEDTVEYDAGAYKTQPNAVIEDLLKRLPGVEVSDDGTITANGKTVKKFLIEGEEFFADDPKIASKNLPVEMIQKLQVVDRKSDLARLTGVDDGEDETVINLTVKPGMKNGWFGIAEAGYGTDDRYKASFNVNRMWGSGNTLTFLGNFNNINEEGFTDDNGNRFRRWGNGGGITKSNAFGVNFNVGNKQILRFGGNLIYSHTDRYSITNRERQYLFPDSTSYLTQLSESDNRGHQIRARLRMEWKPDSFNTLEIRPNLTLNYSDTWSTDSSLTRDGHLANVNRSLDRDNSDGHSLEASLRVIYSHSFKARRGRSFSVMANYSHSDTREDENSYSEAYFWRRLPYILNDSIDLYDQVFDNHTWNNNVSSRLTWTEPIGNVANGNFLEFSYNIRYRWNDADKLVYDHPITWPDGFGGRPIIDYDNQVLNDTLSNQFRNTYFSQTFRIGYRKVNAKYTLNTGLELVPQRSASRDLIIAERNIPPHWILNLAPYLRLRYKFTKTMNLQADYSGRASLPSMTQLQPVPDTSDPLRITIGNPNLNPEFGHEFNVRFNDFNGMAQRSFMFMLNGSVTQNKIISRTSFNAATGGQTTTYENVNGVWSGRFMGMYSQPLSNKAWSVSLHTFIMLNNNVGYNNGERNRSFNSSINVDPGIAFRPDNFEIELRPSYGFQATHNSISRIKTPDTHRYGGRLHLYWYLPFGLTLNSDLHYTATSGYSAGYNRNEWMWNASISYQTLRDKSLTLSIKAYDLLHQTTSISRSVTANYIDDQSFNTLTRYFMATVAWRFNTIGKGARTSGYGDGHRGGHMGPPPGGPGGRGGRF
ncbi:MAG: TonB-dependent receptor [Pseudoflavonifractor sp.]|nr:TonB-dependent receptor [Alloprevotella sp.]MCM1116524.1 TonB-dependent receptor [Pseudoflavonifractor sp.]